ncbi:MAG: DUF177 domain-containing protein [Ilumatobacteraceae bacterium]
MANPLRIQVSELLRRPGSDKPFDLAVTIADLGLDDDRFQAAEPVEIHLVLESLIGGVVVNGGVDATWHGTCRRCAMPAAGSLHCDVHELYQSVVTDPEAFELTGDQLDLEPMVREVLILDAPVSPLCRADCAGLCPGCGIDRNTATCDCKVEPDDSPWSALDDLKGLLDS